MPSTCVASQLIEQGSDATLIVHRFDRRSAGRLDCSKGLFDVLASRNGRATLLRSFFSLGLNVYKQRGRSGHPNVTQTGARKFGRRQRLFFVAQYNEKDCHLGQVDECVGFLRLPCLTCNLPVTSLGFGQCGRLVRVRESGVNALPQRLCQRNSLGQRECQCCVGELLSSHAIHAIDSNQPGQCEMLGGMGLRGTTPCG